MFHPADPVFWVMIAFIGFVALLIYYGVPGIVGKALDDRATAIRADLEVVHHRVVLLAHRPLGHRGFEHIAGGCLGNGCSRWLLITIGLAE